MSLRTRKLFKYKYSIKILQKAFYLTQFINDINIYLLY